MNCANLTQSYPTPSTEEWKRIYRMRVAIERYFRSANHSRLLDQHQCMGIGKMRLHVAMSRLAYLATALAHLEADDYKGMRHMSVIMPRTAGRDRPGVVEVKLAEEHDCGCHSYTCERHSRIAA